MADARDVCQNVQWAGRLKSTGAIFFTGNIQRNELAANALRHRPAIGFIAVGNPDLGPGQGENFGNRRANAGSRPGNQGGFFCEIKHDKSFLRSF